MNIGLMQGTPAYIEYLKTDGKRRHPARCKYSKGTGKNRKCFFEKSQFYNTHCNSAARCNFYDEK